MKDTVQRNLTYKKTYETRDITQKKTLLRLVILGLKTHRTSRNGMFTNTGSFSNHKTEKNGHIISK